MNYSNLTVDQLENLIKAKKELKKQASKKVAKTKKRIQAKQAKQAKERAYNLAENKLRGLSAWAKFLQSEHGYTYIYELGHKIDFQVRRLELLRAFEKIDAERIEKSPLTVSQMANRGLLILTDKDGDKRRAFTNAQVNQALRYIAKAGERSVILSKVA